jgi:hypothetical protein
MVLFKNNPFEDTLLFHSPDKSRQRTLQSLAHKLDPECEYTVATRTVKISRSFPESSIHLEPATGAPINFSQLGSVGGAFGDISDNTFKLFGDTSCSDTVFGMHHFDQPLEGTPNRLRQSNENSSTLLDLESENSFSPDEMNLPENHITSTPRDSEIIQNIMQQSRQIPGFCQDIEREENGQESMAESCRFDRFQAPKTSKNGVLEVLDQLDPNLNTTKEPEKDMLNENYIHHSAPTPVTPRYGDSSKKRKNTERSASPIISPSPPSTLVLALLFPLAPLRNRPITQRDHL